MEYNLRKRKQINCYSSGWPIRKLIVYALPERATQGALTTYFSKYGEIQYCEFFRKPTGFKCFSVIFKTAEAAAEAFARKNHSFLGRRLEVSIVQPPRHTESKDGQVIKSFDDADDASLTKRANESTNLTGTYLMSLNDDCLIQILSYLYISDLCSVAEASDRLRDLAGYVLSTTREHEECMRYALHYSTMYETRRMLSNFGSFMTFVSISGNTHQKLDIVTRYCGDKLDHIALSQFVVTRTMALKLQALFSKMKMIALHSCRIQRSVNPKKLFADCMRLEELRLQAKVEPKNKVLEMTFRALISLHIDIDDLVGSGTLRSFFERHPNLKTLELDVSESYCPGVVESLIDYLPKLEKLEVFRCMKYIENVQRLAVLQHLKSLYLHCGGKSITPFLEESKSTATLETLALHDTTADDAFYTSLARFKTIRELNLSGISFVDDIVGFIALQNLTKLYIDGEANITEECLFELILKLPKLVRILLVHTSFALGEGAYERLAEMMTQQSNRPTLKIINSDDKCLGRDLLAFRSVKYYHVPSV